VTDTAAGSNVLFISHNAADRPFALALQAAIHELVDSHTLIDVRYSTSDDAGPQGGEKWREWIYRQVVEARTTLLVVTPHALGKPWLLWEAGACWGAALARKVGGGTPPDNSEAAHTGVLGDRLIVSIAYGLADSECPDPLRGEQIVQGANADRIRLQLRRILRAHGISGDLFYEAGERMHGVLERYLVTVRNAMMRAPSLVNEANVQDWLSRLDALVRSDRLSELGGFQRWMTLAFGRETDEDADTGGVPIDVRLHRRLGELYLGQRQYDLAVKQLRLAWRAAPRDIYVLRPLAEASMKRLLAGETASKDLSTRAEIETLLDAIGELDDRAFKANPEAAGLRAKYLRRVVGDPEQALQVYQQGLEANPNSYYLADLVAQTQLELGRRDDAQVNFRRALDIIERVDESNIWSHATAATACVGLGDLQGARRHLTSLAALGEPLSESQVDTISRGIREVAQRLGNSEDVQAALSDALAIRRVDSSR
jgi:tetratricopeptide (TPR) repeat protein